MNNLIFLDIDGVLNSEEWYIDSAKTEIKDDKDRYHHIHFSPILIENLNWIIEETNAELVISSVWRFGKDVSQLQKLMDKVGVKGKVVGRTGQLSFNKTNSGMSVPRGCEIEDFLKYVIGWNYLEKVKYVILDDDKDMLYKQKDYFININSKYGLTKEKAGQAIEILNDLQL